MVSELLVGEGGVKRQLRLSDPRAGSSHTTTPPTSAPRLRLLNFNDHHDLFSE